MKQTKIPSREEVKGMIQRELHEQQREDVKVEVAFVVNFDGGDPAIVNTIIDPYQPFPRWKCKKFVKDIIDKLKELEAKKAAEFLAQASVPETTLTSIPNQSEPGTPVVL